MFSVYLVRARSAGSSLLILGGLFCLAVLSASQSAAQGTAFTYQGRLNRDGVSANGIYQMTYGLFDSSNGVSQVGSTFTNLNVGVTNGLFTVTLDFGSGIFTGSNRWMAIAVRGNNETNFMTLSPLQQLTPSPYAIYAGIAATVPDGSIGPEKITPGSIGSAQLSNGISGSQTFTNSGVFVAPSNTTFVFVTLIGGGGGGGAGDQIIGGDNYGGGGGGAGGIAVNYPVMVTPGISYVVTVGAAGVGAPPGQAGGSPSWQGYGGGAGGNSDFGSLIFAYGGGGGGGGTGINEGGGGSGGGGGATTSSTLPNLGYTGASGGGRGSDNSYVAGNGASSVFGSGGIGANGGNANGVNATGYGAGGGGGAPSNNGNGTGGNGSPGVVIVRY